MRKATNQMKELVGTKNVSRNIEIRSETAAYTLEKNNTKCDNRIIITFDHDIYTKTHTHIYTKVQFTNLSQTIAKVWRDFQIIRRVWGMGCIFKEFQPLF